MTAFLIYIKRHFVWFWHLIEMLNGHLFRLLHPDFATNAKQVLDAYKGQEFDFSPIRKEEIGALSDFLSSIPKEHLVYFNPHLFDEKTLCRMYDNKAFFLMKVTRKDEDKSMVGYFFLRCFFIGRAYHGLVVKQEFCDRGIGTAMWALAMDICAKENLRMFATIYSLNAASLRSVQRATDVTILEHLSDNYLHLECKKKTRKDD